LAELLPNQYPIQIGHILFLYHAKLKNKINPYSAKVLSNQWVASQILAQ